MTIIQADLNKLDDCAMIEKTAGARGSGWCRSRRASAVSERHTVVVWRGVG